MALIDYNLQKYDGEFKKAGMERLVRAADVIRDAARAKCAVGTITRIPGRKYFVLNGKRHESTNPPVWMERSPAAMKKTIRTVRQKQESEGFDKEKDNVRIYAGNFKTWWAMQMEYGFGAWKGKAKPFMRPALRESESKVRDIIEGK